MRGGDIAKLRKENEALKLEVQRLKALDLYQLEHDLKSLQRKHRDLERTDGWRRGKMAELEDELRRLRFETGRRNIQDQLGTGGCKICAKLAKAGMTVDELLVLKTQAARMVDLIALPTWRTGEVCPLCQEPLLEAATAVALPCDHLFHAGSEDCMGLACWKQMDCPTCRREYQKDDVVANPVADDERWDNLVEEAKLVAALIKGADEVDFSNNEESEESAESTDEGTQYGTDEVDEDEEDDDLIVVNPTQLSEPSEGESEEEEEEPKVVTKPKSSPFKRTGRSQMKVEDSDEGDESEEEMVVVRPVKSPSKKRRVVMDDEEDDD